MQVCGAIADEALRARIISLAAGAGWNCWIVGDPGLLQQMVATLSPPPDVVISDELANLEHLADPSAVRILLATGTLVAADRSPALPAAAGASLPSGAARHPPESIAHLDAGLSDTRLIAQINDCVNALRFRVRFAGIEEQEPISRLPRVTQLLGALSAHRDHPMGLLLAQVDHAEHLYANLDPVSKTDLLRALAEHFRAACPQGAGLAFHDAASFLFSLPGCRLDELRQLADTCAGRLRAPLRYQGGEIQLTVSMGMAFSPRLVDTDGLWLAARDALQRARQAGGNRIEFPGEDGLPARLNRAMDGQQYREEFSLMLQPQWRSGTRRITGAEALLRWQGLDVGELAPSHFIPIAERHGHMARIGDWVLERACTTASGWLEHLLEPLCLGINVSPQQFTGGAISRQIERLQRERWLDPAMLELELSHAHLTALVDQHREQLYRLRDRGVRFAIDNLGQELIDADRLLRCPADTLKIDRRLIANLTTGSAARDLIAQLCDLAARYRLRVVAVGVEDTAQLHLLEGLGEVDVQGYLLSPPVPLAEFHQLLSEPRNRQSR
ncbi:MAG: GGDEF domain-containing phosphodiesterase [Pseudomonadales bacterium]|nr:EAL domain-containing protein [Pseudomonadales bacterium]